MVLVDEEEFPGSWGSGKSVTYASACSILVEGGAEGGSGKVPRGNGTEAKMESRRAKPVAGACCVGIVLVFSVGWEW